LRFRKNRIKENFQKSLDDNLDNSDKQPRKIQIINNVSDELKLDNSRNFQLDIGLMNYIRCIYGKDIGKNTFTTLDNSRSSYIQSTYVIDLELPVTNGKYIELLLNPDYLFTSNLAKMYGPVGDTKFGIGHVLIDGEVKDIAVNSIKVDNALRYRLLSSRIQINNKCSFKMVSVDIIPKLIVIKQGDNLQQIPGELFPADVRNLSIFEDAKNRGEQLRETKDLDISFVTRNNTTDNIGYLDNKPPVIVGGYDDNANKPDNIQYMDARVGYNTDQVQEIEDHLEMNIKEARFAYQLWKQSFNYTPSVMDRRNYLYIKIETKDGEKTGIKLTSIYQIYQNQYSQNMTRNKFSKYQTSIVKDLKRLREIVYFMSLDELREAFGQNNGLYNVALTKRNMRFIERLNRPNNKRYKKDMLSVLYKL
jgi:hypothetical protein